MKQLPMKKITFMLEFPPFSCPQVSVTSLRRLIPKFPNPTMTENWRISRTLDVLGKGTEGVGTYISETH